MIRKIFITLVVCLGILAVVIESRPDDFRVERSLLIAAPTARIFEQINDFHLWEAWSPWARLDPNMKKSFEGAPSGIGAVHTWLGNQEVGEGRATIIDSLSPERIIIKLEFFEPMVATHTAEFNFVPQEKGTLVTWSMYGTNSFMAKAIGLVMNCDQMVGEQFEKGLANLQAVTEDSK